MPVYKVLLINGDELLSPYRDMPYVENKLYTQKIKPIGEEEIGIEAGLHCYSGSCTVKMKNAYNDKYIIVDTKRRFRVYYESYGRDTDNRIMAALEALSQRVRCTMRMNMAK